jgi:nucleotide-binding universal stress UspA family protein
MLSEAMGSKLVVGVDGSVASDAAVRWAGREALMRGLPITVVNVVAPTLISSTMAPNDTITQGQEDRAREILDRAQRIVDKVAVNKPPNVRAVMVYAGVVPTLLDESRDAQMIVVGSSGPDAFGRTCSARSARGCSITPSARWRWSMIRSRPNTRFAMTRRSSWASTARLRRKRPRR